MNSDLSVSPGEMPGDSYIRTEFGWRKIERTMRTPPAVWDGIVERYFLLVWTQFIQEARAAHQDSFDLDLGDPSTEEGRAYYAANIRFVERQGFSHEVLHLPAQEGRCARYVLRVSV